MRPTSAARQSARTLALLLLLIIAACSNNNNNSNDAPTDAVDPVDPQFAGYVITQLEAGPDLEARAQDALIQAQPKTIIEFPAGYYEFAGELSVSTDNIVLRGQGMDADNGTVLSFKNQTTGGQSINATGDNFVVEHLAVEDSPGDGIKIRGANGVTIRSVRVEWTRGANTENGAYGLYPVQCRNVLIEDSHVRGASDAGVYVGQSELIIVRRNYVWENVAGIEIENSKFADVYDNETTANTGGILVFDLPGPPIQGGEATRVFNNKIYDNNTTNFAPEGNIVGVVPTGTGLMIMANDDIEAFGNEITGNKSAGVVIVSYYINDIGIDKATYDPVPEKIYVHDNIIENNGYAPVTLAEGIKGVVFTGEGQTLDVYYDSSGVGTEAGLLLEFPDGLTESQAICIVDNTEGITLGQANASVLIAALPFDPAISTDPEAFRCTHASLPEIVLEPPVEPGEPTSPVNALELCEGQGDGINAAAYTADCPNLSDYGLFANPADPTSSPNGNGILYDLNTPLFTDYANKHRFVFVPAESAAAYRSQAPFDFPVGTIISKTFSIQADLRDATSNQELIETRLLIKRTTGWTALPYIWNAEKTDAVLTKTGGTQAVNWIDANGVARSTDYIVPNTNNCANCHGEEELLPIGPTARSLNRVIGYVEGAENQLAHWTNANILTGVPADTAAIDAIPLWGDDTATLDDRARGYLDINCAHCHYPSGAGSTSGLYLEFSRGFGFEYGECKPPVAAGAGSGGLSHVIVPGDASKSIMSFRVNSDKTDVRMPEIGRSVIHTEGVELINAWINAMPPRDC